MHIQHLAQFADALAMAAVLGATVWFFFVQSPVLLSKMGREKFVPLQMRLTVVLFRTLTVLLLVGAAASLVHSPLASWATVTAGVAVLGGLFNRYVMVPRALQAGGRSRADIKGKDAEGSVTGFASEGAGNRTRTRHRLVVAWVVVMLVGVVGHGATLLGGCPTHG
ncbi:MAG: DUF4149 domain-containing protein [Deltaproteobacteria bacterium]|nr:DUF4149 domain-containing protein [Deltaproteobacteria bacterium]